MKAILVDDEPLALRDLERQLRKTGRVEISGTYQDGELALTAAFEEAPDIVFLDIDMPELSGIEVAELLLNRLPHTEIVFVTAYEEYAIKAFELNALDYLLKPVIQDRLNRTLDRLRNNNSALAFESSETQGMIRCFQYLQIDFNKLQTIQWRTTKAQELFAYLIHRRFQPVRKDVLIELLWPDTDAKKGFTQLYTAIYQIRKTLRDFGVGIRILSSEKGYCLDLNGMRLDTDEWEQSLQTSPPVTPDTLDLHQTILNQYRGDYLNEYDYLWAAGERERLRTLWFRHSMLVAELLVSEGKLAEAVQLYNRIQDLYPHAEEVYWILMKLFDSSGDWVSVEKQYNSLKKMMAGEIEAEPNPLIQSWYTQWKNSLKS